MFPWETVNQKRSVTLASQYPDSDVTDRAYIRKLLDVNASRIPWTNPKANQAHIQRVVQHILQYPNNPLHPKTPQQKRILQYLLVWRRHIDEHFLKRYVRGVKSIYGM